MEFKDTGNTWFITRDPQIILFSLSYTAVRKMFVRYILPLVKRAYPVLLSGGSLLQSSPFLRNKRCIASRVKSAYEKVKIYVVSDAVMCNDLVMNRMLDKNNINFIGLDCEWESSKKNGVSLIQISSGNDCILYHIFKAGGVIPDNLKQLLEDASVLKFGVAIQEDVRRLHFHGVHVKGFVDLRNLAQRCLPFQQNQNLPEEEDVYKWTSLRSLSVNALDLRLNKSYHVRCSNWEASPLSSSQILYAAKDAIVSLEIFYALVLLRKVNRQSNSVLSDSFDSSEETIKEWVSQHGFDQHLLNIFLYCHKTDQLLDMDTSLPDTFLINKPSQWLVDLGRSLCQGIVDANHRNRPQLNYKNRSTQPIVSSTRGISTKAGKLNEKEYRHQCRDKPLYENCFLVGPDGTVLATVNKSKAMWYVHKALGEVAKESPLTVKLLFEPSGRPMADADYYTTVKENVCVVCGATNSFARKMIIPHDYRKYFPVKMKDHMSHDVLLMCLNCHRYAQQWDEQLRQELAVTHNAPMGTKSKTMFIDNPALSKVKSASKALYHQGSRIPEARAQELRGIIQGFCEAQPVTDELIKELAGMDTKMENKDYKGSHGERVVKSVISDNKLPDFIRMWRQHFLTNMQPKFLPPMWSIDHNLNKFVSSA